MTAPHYRTIDVDGLDVFRREAGSPDAPALLLLHGFPTSCHMFRELIPLLSDRYHIPKAEVRFLDTGHFALVTHAAEIAEAIRGFLGK